MAVNWPALGFVILPNTGGWIGSLAVRSQIKNKEGTAWYQTLKKPTWTPPNWVFAPAWTALYSGMGYASYLVWKECDGFTADAVLPMTLYGTQLALNWSWTPLFFKMHNVELALIDISVLTGTALACAASFYYVKPEAGLLMLPYIAWLGYATALNHFIWKNNPDSKAKITELPDEKKN